MNQITKSAAVGIFHTAIGVIAVVAVIVSYIRFCKINLAAVWGKIYFYNTIITSLTALGISKRGGFNAGHIFSLLIIVLELVAYLLYRKNRATTAAVTLKTSC